MLRGDEIILKNRSAHIDPPRDNDVHIYAVRGNIYYRVGNGQPKLMGGQTFVTTTISGGTVSTVDTRSGRVQIDTAGTYEVLFDNALGVTGDDYNLFFFVRDANGAQPSFDISNVTKFGFTAITYDDNVSFGWKAELKTQ